MKKIKLSLQNLSTVFSYKPYLLLTVLIAVLYYAFNAFIGNASIIFSSFSSYGFSEAALIYITLFLGYASTIKLSSFITLISISILFGVLFSLLIYRAHVMKSVRNNNTKMGFLGSLGVFMGAIAPGCAACGLGIFPLLGISAASLTFLPFGGLELSIIAIIILVFTVVHMSNQLSVCEITRS